MSTAGVGDRGQRGRDCEGTSCGTGRKGGRDVAEVPYPLQKRLGIIRQVGWELQLAMSNLLKQRRALLGVKWRLVVVAVVVGMGQRSACVRMCMWLVCCGEKDVRGQSAFHTTVLQGTTSRQHGHGQIGSVSQALHRTSGRGTGVSNCRGTSVSLRSQVWEQRTQVLWRATKGKGSRVELLDILLGQPKVRQPHISCSCVGVGVAAVGVSSMLVLLLLLQRAGCRATHAPRSSNSTFSGFKSLEHRRRV